MLEIYWWTTQEIECKENKLKTIECSEILSSFFALCAIFVAKKLNTILLYVYKVISIVK